KVGLSIEEVEEPVVQDLDLAHRAVAHVDLERVIVAGDGRGLGEALVRPTGRCPSTALAEVEHVALQDLEHRADFLAGERTWLRDAGSPRGFEELLVSDVLVVVGDDRGDEVARLLAERREEAVADVAMEKRRV